MSCEAEKQALAEMRRRRSKAACKVQHEKTTAEMDVLRSNARVYDWGVVRFAEAVKRRWDSRCAKAQAALEHCKEREKKKAAARMS